MDDFIVLVIAIVITVVAVVSGANAAEAHQCKAKWKDSGMNHRYSMSGGCQVKTAKGVWIPAQNYRAQDAD